jgi:hypothetical protein
MRPVHFTCANGHTVELRAMGRGLWGGHLLTSGSYDKRMFFYDMATGWCLQGTDHPLDLYGFRLSSSGGCAL